MKHNINSAITLMIALFLLAALPACEEGEEVTKVIHDDHYFIPTPDDDEDDDDGGDDDDDDDEYDVFWEFHPVEESMCRDGTSGGIMIREAAEESPNLAIYMEATGICATRGTCEENLDFFEEWVFEEMIEEVAYMGLFNPNHEKNPVRDWHHIYIPPCTGDMHSGTNPSGKVPLMPGTHAFMGHSNMEVYVEYLKEYFDFEPKKILLWGMCSGGNGLFPSYPVLKKAYPGTPITLLNDSGPLGFDDDAFAPCMQQQLRDLYLIDPALPDDCDECFGPEGDGLAEIQTYLAEKYPDGNFGLMMPLQDEAIRQAWGAGMNNCLGALTGELVPEDIFTEALWDLRENHLIPTGRWSTLYAEGDFHTFGLIDDWMFDDWQGNPIYNWVTSIIAGEVPLPVYMDFEEE